MKKEYNPQWIPLGHKHLKTEKIFYLSLRGEAQHLHSYVLYTWACVDNRHIRVILTRADDGLIFETKVPSSIDLQVIQVNMLTKIKDHNL